MIKLDTNVLSELMKGAPAATYADIAVTRRSNGRPRLRFEARIAAIGRSTGTAVATRNVVDFEGCGIDLVNP